MPAPDDLSPNERALVEHVENGEILDLAGKKDRTIRAEVIRDIMRGRLAPDPDPYGILLAGAKIEGRVDLRNVTSSVVLTLLDCLLAEGLTIRDAHLVGLDLSGCELRHTTWPALDAEGLQIDRHVYLRSGFAATSASRRGTVCFFEAHIGGQIDCSSAKLSNSSGPALMADRLRVDHGMHLIDGFEATGAGDVGALHLVGASASELDLTGATAVNPSGPAVDAEDMRVDRAVFLRGFEATGAGERGAVRLLGAHIGGQLDCAGAVLRNDTGLVLEAERAQVDRNVFLRDGFEAIGGGDDVVINLTDLRIGGALGFNSQRVEHPGTPRSRLEVDGLTYGEPPLGVSTAGWLELLREGTPRYRAQPYQQLATALRAAGHDSEARRVLMRQRRDQLERGALSKADRVWARLTGLTLGYGYQPWRALIGLLGVIAISAILAVVLGGHGALVQAKAPAACPVLDQVGIGLDLGTPLITTGAANRCQLTSSATGQWLTGAGWILRLLAWAFATLFVAGFTNAVRKT